VRPSKPDPLPGAHLLAEGSCSFTIWAPRVRSIAVHLLSPHDRVLPLQPQQRGYYRTTVDGVTAGGLYLYRLDGGRELPDPASRAQPDGVHGPSGVVARDFPWSDSGWVGPRLEDLVTYELHVGTFTHEGTFEAIIPHLERLRDLGITVVELMPVCPFPGARNWGYDGVFPFAVHQAYGGPEGLKRLVDACHSGGLGVALDVVYNHLGPEGNYLHAYGPYFSDRYRTPWGEAVNLDGPGSDEVRRFLVASALQWVEEFHVDVLRVDAVHAILDHSPVPFVTDLTAAVNERARELGRRVHVIAESAADDPRTVRPYALGGWGFDAQWNDDFHHCVHALLTGERHGYYQDYGEPGLLAKCFRKGFAYTGEHSAYRARRHGADTDGIPAVRFVVFAQNHDQVGNRARGERLITQAGREAAKLAAALVILSPFLPLLFMGEEYGDGAPFPYFVSHSDADLVEAVRRGRREEFAGFGWEEEIPDPQSVETFQSAKLRHELSELPGHREILALYRTLLRLRREVPALAASSFDGVQATTVEEARVLVVRRGSDADEALLVAHFGTRPADVAVPLPTGTWHTILDTAAGEWGGPGTSIPRSVTSDGEVLLSVAPFSLVLLHREVDRR
jgi:maltooligosyltrehalose trehalohydrolase